MKNNNSIKVIKKNQIESKETAYFWGLDLIRIIAMFFVVLVHSTTFYGFEADNISSIATFFAGGGRYLSFTCIPLFLILTGYLNSDKTPNARYYLKLLKILIEFILCGIIIFIVNRFCFNDTTSFGTVAINMFSFKYPSYSWYISMFVGLFLLIPFFNYLYKSIPNNFKWLFIVSLLLIFSSPSVTNYWTVAYPIMYYFIGTFIKDKQFKVKKYILFLSITGICLLQILIAKFNIPIFSVENHNNIGCLVLSVSIFLLFYDLKISKVSSSMKIVKILRIIANASLSTFLISQIFETLTYRMFNSLNLVTFAEKLPYLTYLTPIKFILSVICGIIISYIALQLYKLITKLIYKINLRKKS